VVPLSCIPRERRLPPVYVRTVQPSELLSRSGAALGYDINPSPTACEHAHSHPVTPNQVSKRRLGEMLTQPDHLPLTPTLVRAS
jgi:hypothetical protein